MPTHMGMNTKSGGFVTADDDTAEINFHKGEIFHRVLVDFQEGRIKVIRGSDDVFDTDIEDYVMAIDKPSHPVLDYAFICGWYESKLTQLLGNDKANDVIAQAEKMAKLNDASCKADI